MVFYVFAIEIELLGARIAYGQTDGCVIERPVGEFSTFNYYPI